MKMTLRDKKDLALTITQKAVRARMKQTATGGKKRFKYINSHLLVLIYLCGQVIVCVYVCVVFKGNLILKMLKTETNTHQRWGKVLNITRIFLTVPELFKAK